MLGFLSWLLSSSPGGLAQLCDLFTLRINFITVKDLNETRQNLLKLRLLAA